MKYYIISNTFFGINKSKNGIIEQINFFKNYFIPKLEKDDCLIHLGNLFSSLNPTIDQIIMVFDLLKEISNIVPIYFILGNLDVKKNFGINYNWSALFKEDNVIFVDNYLKLDNLTLVSNLSNEHSYDKNDFLLTNKKSIILDDNYKKSFKKILTNVNIYDNLDEDLCIIGSPFFLKKEFLKDGYIHYIEDNKILNFKNEYSPEIITYNVNCLEDIDLVEKTYDKRNVNLLYVNNVFYEKYKIKIQLLTTQYIFDKLIITLTDDKITHDDFVSDNVSDWETSSLIEKMIAKKNPLIKEEYLKIKDILKSEKNK